VLDALRKGADGGESTISLVQIKTVAHDEFVFD
jgi:hypothetical protein